LDVGKIYAFPGAQRATDDDFRLDLAVANLFDLQFEQAVIDQDASPGRHILREQLVADVDPLARSQLEGLRREGQPLPFVDEAAAVLDSADADLGPLKILEDGNHAALGVGSLTHEFDHSAMILMGPMRKIEPRHIHPGPDELTDGALIGRGRPERANDLGTTIHSGT